MELLQDFENLTSENTEHSQQWQASLALAYQLFVKSWQLENVLASIRDYENSPFLISTIIKNNIPIAVATYCKNDFTVNVFVSEKHRKQGYGSRILNKLMDEHSIPPNSICGGIGEQGSDNFYHKNKIVCMKNGLGLTNQESEDFLSYKFSYKEILANKINQEYESLYKNEKHSQLKEDNQPQSLKI